MQQLPSSLKQVLENPKFLKVGKSISADARKLKQDFNVTLKPYKDVAELAFIKGAVTNKTVGLQDLVVRILDHHLPKPASIRLGDWDKIPLSEESVKYAGLDALAGLLVYQKLIILNSPREESPPEIESLVPDYEVILLCPQQQKSIAYAKIFSNVLNTTFTNMEGEIKSLNSKSNVLVKLNKALIPAFKLQPVNGKNRSIQEAVRSASVVQVPIRCLRTLVLNFIANNVSRRELPSEPTIGFLGEHQSFEAWDLDSDANGNELDEEEDAVDNSEGDESLTNRSKDDYIPNLHWNLVKVKLDALHAMMRVEKRLHKSHGLYSTFLARFRDALFMPDPIEIRALKSALLIEGKTQSEVDELYEINYSWFLRRVTRTIPEPKVLLEHLKLLEKTYARILDHKSNEPLFSKAVWGEWNNLKKHAAYGCLSDDNTVSLYIERRKANKLLHCVRGTSALEGYHKHVRQLFHSHNVSPQLAVSLLRVFNFKWNLNMQVEYQQLPTIYADGVMQNLIEDFQVLTESFYFEDSEPKWISSRFLMSTGEMMGLIQRNASLGYLAQECKRWTREFLSPKPPGSVEEPLYVAVVPNLDGFPHQRHIEAIFKILSWDHNFIPELKLVEEVTIATASSISLNFIATSPSFNELKTNILVFNRNGNIILQNQWVKVGDKIEATRVDEIDGPEEDPFNSIIPSAKWLMNQQDSRSGIVTKIATGDEKDKFSEMVLTFISAKNSSNQFSVLNSSEFQRAWNDLVPTWQSSGLKIFYKRARHLDDFFKKIQNNTNQTLTREVVRVTDHQLCVLFRPDWRRNDHDIEEERTFEGAPDHPPIHKQLSAPQLSITDTVISAQQEQIYVPPMAAIVNGGPSSQISADVFNLTEPKAKRQRAAKRPGVCSVCGHFLLLGKWKIHHISGSSRSSTGQILSGGGFKCTVPDKEHIEGTEKELMLKAKSQNKWRGCKCDVCKELFDDEQ